MIAFFASATPGRFSRPSSSLNLLAALHAGSYGFTAASPIWGRGLKSTPFKARFPSSTTVTNLTYLLSISFLACVSSQFLGLFDNKVIIKHNLRYLARLFHRASSYEALVGQAQFISVLCEVRVCFFVCSVWRAHFAFRHTTLETRVEYFLILRGTIATRRCKSLSVMGCPELSKDCSQTGSNFTLGLTWKLTLEYK